MSTGELSGGVANVLYLYRDLSYRSRYVWQNSLNGMLKICTLHYNEMLNSS